MKKYFFIFLICTIAFLPKSTLHSHEEKPCYELNVNHSTVHRKTYSFSYDSRLKNPAWVYECLSNLNQISPNQDGKDRFDFKQDPTISSSLQAKNSDFKGSGFDRGHLCPARGHSSEDLEETYYLSNTSPQVPQFNQGAWKKLESYVRNLAKYHAKIHIFSGPLFLPAQATDGKWYVTYQVIGKNQVAVPTHFFKVIFIEKDGEFQELETYILPNSIINPSVPLEEFKATIQRIEKLAGIEFNKTLIEIKSFHGNDVGIGFPET